MESAVTYQISKGEAMPVLDWIGKKTSSNTQKSVLTAPYINLYEIAE